MDEKEIEAFLGWNRRVSMDEYFWDMAANEAMDEAMKADLGVSEDMDSEFVLIGDDENYRLVELPALVFV